MTNSWISNRGEEFEKEARERAKPYVKNQFKAQQQMYLLFAHRRKLEAMEEEINNQVTSILEQQRVLLEAYPTLHFRKPK